MNNYKFSLITPEHSVKNIPFLKELYDSIKKQTYDNWEWVLYLNNGFKKTDLPLDILAPDESGNCSKLDLCRDAFFKLVSGTVLFYSTLEVTIRSISFSRLASNWPCHGRMSR